MSKSPSHYDRSLFREDGEINKKYITDVYYSFLLHHHPESLNLARLMFLNVMQNEDFDALFPVDKREEFLLHKKKILPVIQTLETHRISSLPKAQYKAEIAKITSVVSKINRSAIHIASVLGSLNNEAEIPLEIDAVQDSQIVQDGKKIVMKRKELDTITEMVEQMNHRLKFVIRGSKKNDLFKEKRVLVSNKNFATNKSLFYTSKVAATFFSRQNAAFRSLIANPKSTLDIDTLGFVKYNPEEETYYSFSSLFEVPKGNDVFQLSESFYAGKFKASTFVSAIAIMNCNFRISEWYHLLKRLSYPLHISPEIILEEKDETMDFSLRLRDIDLLRKSIRVNIQKVSLVDLESIIHILGCSSLYGEKRNMNLITYLQEPGTALYTYEQQEDKSVLVEAPKDMCAIDVLSIKNRSTLHIGNFDSLLQIIGNEIPSTPEMEDDAILIVEQQKRAIALRKQMMKTLYVNFMKKEMNIQIQRLRQAGAIR